MSLLAALTLLVSLSYVLPLCDKGWAEYQGECLWFSNQHKTWLDAEADCRKHHAYLATDDNQDKHNFMAQFLNVFTSWGQTHFWLGASDYAFENRWQWLETGGIVTGFTAWNPGSPNGNLSQNCMFTMMNGTVMSWEDGRCDIGHGHTNRGYNYICEKPAADVGSIVIG